MLAFSLSDAHFHLIPSMEKNACFFPAGSPYIGCSCAHDTDEFRKQEKMILQFDEKIQIIAAFGIHPQQPLIENASFMEQLLREKRISVIGEAGFDFFTESYKKQEKLQEEAWHIQIELASRYGCALVVHCRKASDRIFRDAKLLKNIRAVVFHSFAGSPAEAQALLRRGVNAFFSFGKPLLNGDKSARECTAQLPIERLLFETDAPFQTMKGERATSPADIQRVYQEAAAIRAVHTETCITLEQLAGQTLGTFKAVYGIF